MNFACAAVILLAGQRREGVRCLAEATRFARKQKSKNLVAFSLASLCVQSMFGRCSQKLEECDFPLTVQLVDPECASCSATVKSLHVEVEAHSSMS